MSFCTQCGEKIGEGEHICSNYPDKRHLPLAANAGVSGVLNNLDFKTILHLLKNPEHAHRLDPNRDFIYGILGFISSLIGWLFWIWLISKKIMVIVYSLFSGLGMVEDYLEYGYETSGISSRIIGNAMVLGIVSIIALIASLLLSGIWKGSRKLSAKEWLTHIGAMQYTFAAGFLIAGLATFINLRLSLLLLVITLLAALTTSVVSSSEKCRVTHEHRFSYIALSISIYLVTFLLLALIIV